MSLLSSLIPVLSWVSLILLPPAFVLVVFERRWGRVSPVAFRNGWRAFHLMALLSLVVGWVSMTLAPSWLESCGVPLHRESLDVWIGLWAVGVVGLLIRSVRAWRRHQEWMSRSSTCVDEGTIRLVRGLCVDFGLAAPPELRRRRDLEGPAVSGVLHPVLWVPEDFAGQDEGLRRAALAHEIAHLKDRDLGWDLIQRTVRGLLFFHPVLWWSAFAFHRATERAADRRALQCGLGAAVLAKALIRFAPVSIPFGRSASPGFIALEDRLLCLESRTSARRPLTVLSAGLALSFVAPVAVASSFGPVRAAPSLACAIQNQNDFVHELIRHSTPEKPYTER